jgi:hypothetical protein
MVQGDVVRPSRANPPFLNAAAPAPMTDRNTLESHGPPARVRLLKSGTACDPDKPFASGEVSDTIRKARGIAAQFSTGWHQLF